MLVPREDFTLDSSFLDKFRGKQPKWGPLGLLVYKRTYAADKADGTTEEFWETCQRVVEGVYQIQKGHCHRYNLPWSDTKAQDSAQEMYSCMFAFKFLPPGRGLAKMGTEAMFKLGSACLQSCGFVTTRDIGNSAFSNAFSSPFTWTMNMSMLGVGVGFDTLGKDAGVCIVPRNNETITFIVEDSREGWIAYLQQLLQSFVDPAVVFPVADYSLVRPKGARIKGFGGTASGPEALMLLTSRLLTLSNQYCGKQVDSRFIVDVTTSIGECVVAGGTRRSALLSLGVPTDSTFLNLKDYTNNPEASEWPRWAANNSVVVSSNTDFSPLTKNTRINGEPGFIFLDNMRNYGRLIDPADYKDAKVMGPNPCSEIPLETKELCNLVETFPSKCASLEDYTRTLKFAYLYAKTVTLVPTHSPETNAVMLRNRRIGCSQSGIQDNIEKIGVQEHIRWCDQGYKYIRELDTIYSDWLGIPHSIRVTAVKPSGSISKLLGVREGIHESKGEYEMQTIRIRDRSPLLLRLKAANYRIEPAIQTPNTVVVYFPVKYNKSRSRNPTMWEQLELAALIQAYWADNAVSVTIDFDKETEGPEITRALQMYATRLKGVSFLPRNDHGYIQAPKTVITKEEYTVYKDTLLPLDLSGIRTHEVEDKFCSGDLCALPSEVPDAAE